MTVGIGAPVKWKCNVQLLMNKSKSRLSDVDSGQNSTPSEDPLTTKRRTPARTSTAGKRGAPVLRANVAEMRAVAHPLRLRILELFAESPRTTKQVADILGQPPTRLYHHVNALARVGLLQLRETRPNRGVVEKWFGAGPRYAAARPADPRDTSVTGLAMTVLDQSRREVTAALRNRPEGAVSPFVIRGIVVGPEARQERTRERIGAFLESLRREAEREKASEKKSGTRRLKAKPDLRWALTISFAPVGSTSDTPRRRSKTSTRTAGKETAKK
jgi:DNA-binding transcriptional ArsR family regulator